MFKAAGEPCAKPCLQPPPASTIDPAIRYVYTNLTSLDCASSTVATAPNERTASVKCGCVRKSKELLREPHSQSNPSSSTPDTGVVCKARLTALIHQSIDKRKQLRHTQMNLLCAAVYSTSLHRPTHVRPTLHLVQLYLGTS